MNNVKYIEDKNQKENIVRTILLDLPEWFGIKSAVDKYIEECKQLPLFAYWDKKYLGFITLKKQSDINIEMHVLGVLKNYQKKGIGKSLFLAVKEYASKNGYKYITVKTLDSSCSDPNYQKTRDFYYHIGFKKFEVLDTLWDENNICLQMIYDLESE